jgi:hypothetical protein
MSQGPLQRRFLGMAAVAALVAFPALAQSGPTTGPFVNLPGTWAGEGRIALADGSSEPIRCRAEYSLSNEGVSLAQKLRCASDSYKFEIEAAVRYNEGGGVISGTWKETTRNVGGFASGPASTGRMKARVESASFKAEMEVVTQGDTQSVTIAAENADVTEVAIELRKR